MNNNSPLSHRREEHKNGSIRDKSKNDSSARMAGYKVGTPGAMSGNEAKSYLNKSVKQTSGTSSYLASSNLMSSLKSTSNNKSK